MIRLFITLYLFVLASFVLFISFANSLETFLDMLPEAKNLEKRVTQGTFMLLDKSIQGLDKQQREKVLKQHKEIFGSALGLIELSQLPLEKNELARLQQGEIVFSESEDKVIASDYKQKYKHTSPELNLIYKRVPHSTLAWRLNSDSEIHTGLNISGVSVTLETGRFINGMYYLINTLLVKEPEEKWPQIIVSLQPNYGVPLSLLELPEFLNSRYANNDNTEEWRESVLIGDIINIIPEHRQIALVKRISTSNKLLQIGAVTIPWALYYLVYMLIIGFVLSIAMAIFLWIRPVWSNLLKIKKASNEFGDGNYSTRIPYSKYSSLAGIITAFNSMAERTETSIRSHKELTSAVSHELRTPVARMRFALEMLTEADDKKDQQRFANDINQDIDELDSLLEELLTYARFDQIDAALNLSQQNLTAWFEASMKKLMPLANQKILRYQIEGIEHDEMAYLEPAMLSRALDNLVQNALRYAHKHVEVTLTKDKNDYLLIIEDDGEGVPESERAHIFEAFSRLDASRDRASGGFGLGLAIVDRIVKGHKGRVDVKDSELGGARFEVRFIRELKQG